MALKVGDLYAKIGVDDRDFQRGLARMRASLVATAKAVAKGAAWGLLGVALANTVVSVLALVGALSPLVGLLGALPAVLGAAAVATAALKVGTSTLIEALDGKTEALERLTPAARAVYDEIQGQAAGWDAVRRAVEGGIFARVQGHISALGGVYLPLLETRLGRIGEAWGSAFSHAAEAARSRVVVAGVTRLLDATHRALLHIGDAFGPLVRGFGAAFGATAPLVERLGAAIGKAMSTFGDWLREVSESGQLMDWVRDGMVVLRQLIVVLRAVGGIFSAVINAATSVSGGLLDTLGQVLGQVDAFLNSAEGMAVLAAVFGTIKDTVAAIAPALKPVLSALGAVIVAVSPLLPLLGELVAVLATGLAGAVQALIPGLSMVVEALVSGLAPILPLITEHFAAMTPLAAQLGALLGEGLAAAITGLLDVAGALLPVLSQVSQVFATVLIDALTELLPLVLELVPLWRTLAADLLPQLVPLVSSLGEVLLALLPALVPLIELQVTTLSLFARMGTLLSGVVIPVLTVLIQWTARVVQWVATLAGAFLQFLGTARRWSSLGPFVAGLWSRIVSVFRGGVAAAVSIAATMVGRVLAPIRSLIGKVRGLGGSFAGAARSIGTQIINGMISGIKRSVGRAISAVKGAVGGIIRGAKGALGISSPSKVAAREVGRWVPPGIGEGVRQAMPGLLRQFDRLRPQMMAHLQMAGPPVRPAAPAAQPPVIVRTREGDTVNVSGAGITMADVERYQRRREVRARVGRPR